MCDPVSIAGAALTAGSLVANTAAQGQVDSARNSAVDAENQRQQRLRKEAAQSLDSAEQPFKDFGAGQAAKQQQIGDILNGATTQAPPPTAMVPQASDPTVVAEVGKQSGNAKAFTQQQGQALGKMRGFGSALADANRNLGRDAGWIGTLGGFQQGSANVNGLELANANNAGSGLNMLGDALNLAGGLTSAYGLTKAAAPASALTAAGTPPIPAPLPAWRGGAGALPAFFG